MKKDINYYRKLGYNWDSCYITRPFRSFGAEIAYVESLGYRLATPEEASSADGLVFWGKCKTILPIRDPGEWAPPYPVYLPVKLDTPATPLEDQLVAAKAKVAELEKAIEDSENISIPFQTIKEFAEHYSKTDCYFDSTARERFLRDLLAKAKK